MAPGGDNLIPGAARPAAVGAPLGRGGAGRCSWCPGSLRRAALAELQQFPGPRGEDVSGRGGSTPAAAVHPLEAETMRT